ncbi:CHAT domain-containing protein [Floridanema aerugineum]|uniref:CHAT domain-containing protein n=1 Tax=Floridaenema aerugineum BLCC-F46 TaxID=3153654 RepID=A0ABV4WZY3_9CYAN
MRSPIQLIALFTLFSLEFPLGIKFATALSVSTQEVKSSQAKNYLGIGDRTISSTPQLIARRIFEPVRSTPTRDYSSLVRSIRSTPTTDYSSPRNRLILELLKPPSKEQIEQLRQFDRDYKRIEEQLRRREREEKKWREQQWQSTYQSTPQDLPPKPRQIAAKMLQRGIQEYQKSQFSTAIGIWQPALDIYRSEKDRNGEATVLKNLGNAYNSVGQYTKAIESLQLSLNIFRSKNNRKAEVSCLIGLGDAYHFLGQSSKAKEFYQQSLTIARSIGDRNGEARAMTRLGRDNTAGTSDRYMEVIEFLQEALVIAQGSGDRTIEVNALNNLATAYVSLGQGGKALIVYEQALKLAREIGDRSSEAHTLNSLGNAYFSLWQSKKTINFYSQALTIFRDISDRRSEGEVLNNLGFALLKTGHLIDAEKHLLDAIAIWESLRSAELSDKDRVSLFETQQTTYRLLQQVLIAQNKPELALEIAERGRARAFVELLAQRLASDPANSNVLSSLNKNNSANLSSPTLAQIQEIAKIQNTTIVQYSIVYDDFNSQGQTPPKESELYIWVIKPTGETKFEKVDLKLFQKQHNTSLSELVFTSRDSIGVRSLPIVKVVPRPGVQQRQQANLTQQLQQLHQILIAPIADRLPTDPNAKVTFIPQGELFLVPFPALQDQQGQYLIEKHTIITAPSIQVLALTRQQRQKANTGEVLVVGNPTMPSVAPGIGQLPEQLPSLPGAETEAKAIAPLFKTRPLIGNAATKATIVEQLPLARIVHFATHGLLDDVQGLESAIALAPSNNDNGLLTADEILNLKLNAELVVLSACNTGRGRITGDGVVGLSRSLISAGVSSVIVSLWAVPDAPTASLMTEFYQNWQNNSNKAQALRQAMLTTMKQHPDPKNWAAFTLIGEAE